MCIFVIEWFMVTQFVFVWRHLELLLCPSQFVYVSNYPFGACHVTADAERALGRAR
jgi:hypothetical protein